jgi:hypothetical protein
MAGKFRRGLRRPRFVRNRVVPAVAALIGAGALAVPGVAAAAGPQLVVKGDSLLATSLPTFGQATVNVTRPDALTGTPVVIGTYSGTANQFTPFSVNSTTPTPGNPTGDCWQKGALSQALTPDLQPGDTVTLTQAGMFGGGGTTLSTTVQPGDLANVTAGPISGCSSVAPWARNAIASAPSTLGRGADLAVSGVAQPLATGVSVSASDGSNTTAPVSVTPASDGTWSATIPAASLAGLSGTQLTVTPMFTVPDVSTGKQANIAGVGASVTTSSASTASGSGNGTASPADSQTTGAPTQASVLARVASLRAASRVSLASARKHGLKVSFVVPSGVSMLQIRLLHNGKSRYTATVYAHRAGTRQTITIPAGLFKRLSAGKYSLAIKAGTSRTAMGAAVSHALRLTK